MMTSREQTGLLTLSEQRVGADSEDAVDVAYRLAFGAIGWPWLLYSLWGGTKASKAKLLARIGLDDDALPHLGSWKADTGFLHRIVDAVEDLRPQVVVELGAGASSLVCAKALQLNGGGRLVSYDQHDGFVDATRSWLADHGIAADIRHAPLTRKVPGYRGVWYDVSDVPDQIDLLIIDGPPWSVHPYIRGAAESLFDRLAPGGVVLLDDAARPGERIVARRWRKRYPHIDFRRLPGSTKGTLIGWKSRQRARIIPLPARNQRQAQMAPWRRAAAILALLGTGWIAHEVSGGFAEPAYAASFVDEASASHAASLARQQMGSQIESTRLDRAEIARTTGLSLPGIPAGWRLADVQVYPAESGMSVVLVMRTAQDELVSLFATRAETPAEQLPMLAKRQGRSVAYWEVGPFAYALTGEQAPARVLAMAAEVEGTKPR